MIQKNEICYGDRLVVRVELPEGKVLSFVSSELKDMTEILGEIRRVSRGCEGLARMSIRNTSRGWRLVRPLRLYADRFAARGFGNVRRQEPRMLAPWETH